ncbi:MAG TPA: SRPBCC family protein [Gaiellaceae bacterium]|nr:SRPBCC family protein [Gaiellaceae bacterium]
MADYRFLTTWLLDCSPLACWEAIHEPERWPDWWPGVLSVERLADGNGDGVGSVYRNAWRGVIPYTVRFDAHTTRVERPHVIELEARGELAGTGRWRIFDGPAVAVTYEWSVRTTRPWMNALAPVARPLFAWNHNAVMRRGGEGLAGLLGARLLASS